MGIAPSPCRKRKYQAYNIGGDFLDSDDDGDLSDSEASFCIGSDDEVRHSDDEMAESEISHDLEGSDSNESTTSSDHDSLAEELHEKCKRKEAKQKDQIRKKQKHKPLKKRLRLTLGINYDLEVVQVEDAFDDSVSIDSVPEPRSGKNGSARNVSLHEERGSVYQRQRCSAELYNEDDEEVKPEPLDPSWHSSMSALAARRKIEVTHEETVTPELVRIEERDTTSQKLSMKMEETFKQVVKLEEPDIKPEKSKIKSEKLNMKIEGKSNRVVIELD